MATTAIKLPYQAERDELFTTAIGRRSIAWGVHVAANKCGSTFTMQEFHNALANYGGGCQPWMTLNLLDYLKELGMLRELTSEAAAGQNRCFQFSAK